VLARYLRRTRRRPASSFVVPALTLLGTQAAAQERPWVRAGAHAVAVWLRADPVPGGASLGEVRVVQPVGHLEAGVLSRVRLRATLNLEGATLGGGELTPGAWGEGFIDRRHPHTYVHELLVGVEDVLGARDGAGSVSFTVGKGFAPFGTDDPMMRPPLRYPVNHHLAQILERAVAIVAVRQGPLSAELGLFNGDEPERPGQWPRVSGRFADSWSARLTAAPLEGLELQGSYAQVHSPEHRPGAGTDQSKWSLSARWLGPVARRPVEALVEWARTSEADGFFVFHSLLAEGAWSRGRLRLHYRVERTERPEEERLSGFRSLRPHLENSILGRTRWTIHTAGAELRGIRLGGVRVGPLAEVSLGSVRKVGGGLFEVEDIYGRDDLWTVSLGVRVTAGAAMPRMGRYGAAAGESGSTHHEH
jgi:hypothetical protein